MERLRKTSAILEYTVLLIWTLLTVKGLLISIQNSYVIDLPHYINCGLLALSILSVVFQYSNLWVPSLALFTATIAKASFNPGITSINMNGLALFNPDYLLLLLFAFGVALLRIKYPKSGVDPPKQEGEKH